MKHESSIDRWEREMDEALEALGVCQCGHDAYRHYHCGSPSSPTVLGCGAAGCGCGKFERESKSNSHPTDQNSDLQPYTRAAKIAKAKTRGRHYRDDAVSDAYLAVAEGETSRRGIENAIRRSVASERSYSARHLPILSEGRHSSGAAARSVIGVWDAVSELPTRQRQAIELVYDLGMTQEDAAWEMGVAQPVVNEHIKSGLSTLQKRLRAPYKK